MTAQAAKNDGARVTAGQGATSRPCEPADILQTLNRLYRQRRLQMDHIRVLKHYGERHMAPDPRRPREIRAYLIWAEALERLEALLESKGIVRKPAWFNPKAAANWIEDVMIYEQMEA
ncbi:MAG: hypothetical protein LRY57_03010 [Alphaproteobacteria bacterium]|nr:hypothetical protein [Alphaproteobacteria bacterium]